MVPNPKFNRCLANLFCAAIAVSVFWAGQLPAQDAATQSPATPGPTTEATDFKPAWEYMPYRVAVWVCTDGSPLINTNLPRLSDGIMQRSRLLDPSGWNLSVSYPDPKWRWKLLNSISNADQLADIAEHESLAEIDKLMIVCINQDGNDIRTQVRELDIQTRQWGPMIEKSVARFDQLDAVLISSIANAFMPIARIDRVTTNPETRRDDVYARARAVNSCIIARRGEDGEWVSEVNQDSPAWIQPADLFLPVIRRTDRDGNLIKLEPVEYTYLTIDKQDGPISVCSIHSYHRAPLAGRTSKRAQKLALVIRPPGRSTTLRLVSRDDETLSMEGVDILSRRPNQPREEKSEVIGRTDWQGLIEIPPSPDGVRVIYVKRGYRALKKLPIIPGLHDYMETSIINDETRLYAEGVIDGIQKEILNLVAQRQVFEAEIDNALKNNDRKLAQELLNAYQKLPSVQAIKGQMSDEETRLKSQTTDGKEAEFIGNMFSTLREILNSKVVKSREAELRARMQASSQ